MSTHLENVKDNEGNNNPTVILTIVPLEIDVSKVMRDCFTSQLFNLSFRCLFVRHKNYSSHDTFFEK